MFRVASFALLFISTSTALADGNAVLSIAQSRDDLAPKDIKRVEQITRQTVDFSKAEKFEASQGGAGTSRKTANRNAFSHTSANLTFEDELTFKLGNALFRKFWVSSPSSNHASDGLGPLYNARACQSCHLKDGRGHPPASGETDFTSMLFRLARPAETDKELEALRTYAALNIPDPVYGGQIQDFAIVGLKAEAKPSVTYEENQITLEGGEVVSLRKPTYQMTKLAYGDLHPKTTLSPRIAQPMIGLGLIEAIHPFDLAKKADPKDQNADGISGKLGLALDLDGKPMLGRFGWKASQATLGQQNAAAFNGDIGISSELNPSPHGDCTTAQVDCVKRATGVQPRLGDSEAPDPVMGLVDFYTANLAVPARRDVTNAQVLRGKGMFYGASCVACHTPKYVTSRKAERKEHRFQLIWPYSDFLLHDMGEGLADNQQVGVATGREWRTAPLWGLGLTKTVNGHTFFLHDGRARNYKEAILWHGGEAKTARNKFVKMQKTDRDALIKFLESL
ncbi:MAG: di-heme oxidoredictase family protein [Hyphomicrobiales bacterium]